MKKKQKQSQSQTLQPSTLLSKISDSTALNNLGILCFTDKDIQKITSNSGTTTITNSNEYQVHYWFLNGRFTLQDNSIIDIAIPTVYFNYTQKVTSSSIDFELEDVDTMSEALLPVHNTKVNELLSNKTFVDEIEKLSTKLTSALGPLSFQWLNINLGTIHKHPGSLDSFSGTDLSTSVKSPGICFPFGPLTENDIDHKPSFSSIMLLKNKKTIIGHTEYRTASMLSDKHIQYQKHRALTLAYAQPTTVSKIEQFIGIQPKDNSYILTDELTEEHVQKLDIHETLLALLGNINYTANTRFISPKNVTKRSYAKPYSTSTYSYNTNSTTVPHRNSTEWKRVHSIVMDVYDIELHSFTILSQMTPQKREAYYKELYYAFYAKEANTTGFVIQATDIIKLQDMIWLDTKNEDARLSQTMLGTEQNDAWESLMGLAETPVNEMKKDLISWGVDRLLVGTSTDAAIKSMWKHVMDEVGEE